MVGTRDNGLFFRVAVRCIGDSSRFLCDLLGFHIGGGRCKAGGGHVIEICPQEFLGLLIHRILNKF